jgi:hypothetical protein
MKKPLVIGQRLFKYKKDALLYYKNILNSYEFDESLSDVHCEDLINLYNIDHDEKSEEEVIDRRYFQFDRNHFGTELDVFSIEEKRHIKCPISKVQFVKFENAKKLSKELLIFKNERYYCIIDGDFIFGDFIEAFITVRNMDVKELTISTSSLSEENVYSLHNLLKMNYVESLNLIVSDQFFSYEKDNLIPFIYENLDFDNRFQLSVCANRSKIILIESEYDKGRKYVIQTSANMNSSNNIEQFCIEENEELYDWNKNILDGIIEKFKTIEKEGKINDKVESTDDRIYILDGRNDFEEDSPKNREIIDVKVVEVQYGTKCFKVFFNDLSTHIISYIMFIQNTTYNPFSLFNKACRNVVSDDMLLVKQEYFNANAIKGYVKCQETNELSKWEDLVVDHRQPNTFSVIVDRFKEIKNIELEHIEYITDENNFIVFKNQNLRAEFINYHKEKANLRIVRKECNLSRTGMGRLKRSTKDLIIK